jgi:hypothetical protein
VLRAAARAGSLEAPAVRDAFFRAAATISSDGEKHGALAAALARRDLSKASLLRLIREARDISSDGEKSALLVSAIRAYPPQDAEVRDAILDAAEGIGSDGDYRTVMRALNRDGSARRM